jgi:hypothetical protein
MIMRSLVVIALSVLLTGALSLSQEVLHICEVTGEKSWIPYTGLKIQRDFIVKDRSPPLLKFVTMSHCQRGDVDTERVTRTEPETDVDWGKPVCFLDQKKIVDDKVSQLKNWRTFNRFRNLTFGDLPKLPHARNILAKPPQILQPRAMRDGHENSLRKIPIDNSQNSLATELEDLNVISSKDITQDDLVDLRCYKMARRKKYSQRKMTMYAPQTWVGGLFECQVSDEDKARYLASLKRSDEFPKPLEIKCESSSARPVLPLIADDSSSPHFEVDSGVLTQLRIPYLFTLDPLDQRYKMPAKMLGFKTSHHIDKEFVNHHESSELLPYDTWFKEIDVNENYNFLPEDRESLSQIIEQSTALLAEFLELNSQINEWDWDQGSLFGTDEVQGLGYMELKAWYIFSKTKEREVGLQLLKAIQQPWDNLQLSSETFYYQLPVEL